MNNTSAKTIRQSNIELLRIGAAFGVIIQHYNNPHIGGAINAIAPLSPKGIIFGILHVAMVCAVNLFVLISGYFMRDVKKRDLLKPIRLLTALIVFQLLFFVIQVPLQGEPFSFNTLLHYFIPYYWYIFVYIALYMISPYVNVVWMHLSRLNRKRMLIMLLGLFSFYPIFLDIVSILIHDDLQGTSPVGMEGSDYGYTIVNFVLMYLIGCAIRDHEEQPDSKEPKPVLLWILLALNTIVLFFWVLIENASHLRDPAALAIPFRHLNPVVISQAILYFLLFKQFKMKNSRIINSLATASFASYLIHVNLFRYCGIVQAAQKSTLIAIAHLIGCTVGIYLLSWVLYTLYNLATRPLFDLIERKWTHNRTYSVD